MSAVRHGLSRIDPRGRRAHLHAALRRRRRRVEVGVAERVGEAAAAAALGDDPAPVAVDLERDDRVGEADPVVVEEHDRVQERVGEARDSAGACRRTPCPRPARGAPVARYLPACRCPAMRKVVSAGSPQTLGGDAGALPRARLDLVVGEHAEGRDDVLGEVLVLVVAPDRPRRPGGTRRGCCRACRKWRSRPRDARPRSRCRRRRRTRAASRPASSRDRGSAPGGRGPAGRGGGCRPCSRPGR